MRSFENQIRDGNNSTKIVSPRLMPDVQYVYIRKFAKCFLIFENPFIILKGIIFISSTPFLFIRAVLMLLLKILMNLNGVYDKYFWILF